MKMDPRTTLAVVGTLILATLSVLAQPAGDGAQARSLRLASPQPTVRVSPGTGTNAGNLTLMWDANAVGFTLQSRSAVPGTNWVVLKGTPNPITGAGTALSATSGGAAFYELKGPRGVGPRIASPSFFAGRVDVPILEAADRVPATSLTVSIQPESAMVETNHPVIFAALVDGYEDGAFLSFKWEWNKSPYTTNLVTTDSTWRDLNIGSNTNFIVVDNSPDTNVFTIPSVTTNDVAYYRVTVTTIGTNGTNIASSAAAPLWVWEPATNSITTQGTPVQLLGGSSLPCPGPFSYIVPFPGVYPDPPANPANPVNVFDDLTLPGTSVYWSTSTGRYKDQSCAISPSDFLHAQIRYASKAATVPWYFTVYIPSGSTPPALYSVYMQFH